MKISFVVPTFREEKNIAFHYDECIEQFKNLKSHNPKYKEYEYLVIDNCSDDNTVGEVLKIRDKDHNVKLFVNDRNYGPVLSPFEGLIKSTGDVAILIAADLQEPPNLISEFTKAIDEGFDAAIGLKQESKESFIMWYLRGLYYLVLKKIGLIKSHSRYSGFGLYKRELINNFKSNNLDEPSLRILLPLKTKNIKAIPYKHRKRLEGDSSYSIFGYFREAIQTVIRNSTTFPKYAARVAIALTSFCFLMVPAILILKILLWEVLAPGLTTIILIMLIFNSGILLFISVILDRQDQILSRLKPARVEVKQSKIYT